MNWAWTPPRTETDNDVVVDLSALVRPWVGSATLTRQFVLGIYLPEQPVTSTSFLH
jgi:hypothetical protein